jgi:hypothetical protein
MSRAPLTVTIHRRHSFRPLDSRRYRPPSAPAPLYMPFPPTTADRLPCSRFREMSAPSSLDTTPISRRHRLPPVPRRPPPEPVVATSAVSVTKYRRSTSGATDAAFRLVPPATSVIAAGAASDRSVELPASHPAPPPVDKHDRGGRFTTEPPRRP